VYVEKGGGGPAHVDACGQGGQKPDFLWTSLMDDPLCKHEVTNQLAASQDWC